MIKVTINYFTTDKPQKNTFKSELTEICILSDLTSHNSSYR
jgi:hypothetical protein